jgi:hypothetical protein
MSVNHAGVVEPSLPNNTVKEIKSIKEYEKDFENIRALVTLRKHGAGQSVAAQQLAKKVIDVLLNPDLFQHITKIINEVESE